MRKKERFVLGKRTFRSQKSKHFVLRIIKHRAMNIIVALFFPTFNVVLLEQFINIALAIDNFTFYLDKGD